MKRRGPVGCTISRGGLLTAPWATEPDVVEALLALRRRHPRWGARKSWRSPPSRPVLRHGRAGRRSALCSRRAGWSRLGPAGIATRRAVAPAPITAVNQAWTTDFKGHFRTGDHAYCYPLTLRDGFSRFVLRCEALAGPTYEATRPQFERAFADYGLPDRIRSDNGGPFASTGLRRLSRLSVWWLRLGIQLERIAPGHPEQNGSHEQFHSVLKAETARPPAANARAQQRRFTRFCAEYRRRAPARSAQRPDAGELLSTLAAIAADTGAAGRISGPLGDSDAFPDWPSLVGGPAVVSLRRLGRRGGGL